MYRRLFFFGLTFFLPLYGCAQSGFSKTFDFTARAAGFKNCILVGDTVVITGSILPQGSNQWSAMLARMDTNGQLIDLHYFPDTMGDHFTQPLNVAILKTSDGGYMMTGSMYSNAFGAIVKIDKDDNLEFYKKYPDDKYFLSWKILELADGYFVLGIRQRANFRLDAYLMKIDKKGDILWDKYLGDWELDETGSSLLMVDSNYFVVGGSKGKNSTPNLHTRSSFWALDSLGNIKREWQSSPPNIESAAFGLQHLSDGGWLYSSRNTIYMSALEWGGNCKIVRRDSNMNLLWERTMPHATTPSNALWDIKPTPDGNWLAVGNWIPFYSENPDSVPYLAGVLHKFSPEGDSIWTVLDTAFWHPLYGSENHLGGAVVLPSGSTIAVGNSTNFNGQFKSWAWMLKVDNDGCVDTLCTIVGSEEAPLLQGTGKMRVYPNPAGGQVRFDWPSAQSLGRLVITDATGRTMLESSLQQEQTSLIWDTFHTASGVYFYQFQRNGGSVQGGKIIIRH